MNLKKDPALLVIGLAVLATIGMALLSNLSEEIRRRSRQSNTRPDDAYMLKQAVPLESLKEDLNQRIARFRQGDRQALPFLSGATNISLVSVRESANTHMPTAEAVVLADGRRHHLEIPLNISPVTFIETLPSPPSVADLRRHVEGEIQHLLKGEKSELRLPNHGWTNIYIESFNVASNYASSWPYRAQAVLVSRGFDSGTRNPIEHRSGLLVNYMDENDWALWYQPIMPPPKAESESK